MRILVIGTGTIGRAVVAALSAGNEIISASLLRPRQASLGFRDSSETEPGRTLRSRLVRS